MLHPRLPVPNANSKIVFVVCEVIRIPVYYTEDAENECIC